MSVVLTTLVGKLGCLLKETEWNGGDEWRGTDEAGKGLQMNGQGHLVRNIEE